METKNHGLREGDIILKYSYSLAAYFIFLCSREWSGGGKLRSQEQATHVDARPLQSFFMLRVKRAWKFTCVKLVL